MLIQATTITGATGTSGTYTATVLFSDASKAPFVRVGDILEDRLANRYTITTWSTFPSDFGSGGIFTVDFITTDVIPATFGGFGNAAVFTDNQIPLSPNVRSQGNITAQSLDSGQGYLYSVSAAWFDPSASEAVVGDHITDCAGTAYEIVVTNVGATTVVVKEVFEEGTAPCLGIGTLYSPTSTLQGYQGTILTDAARTVIRNTDMHIVDSKINELNSIVAGGSTAIQIANTTGSTIVQGTPVGIDTLGEMQLLDVSVETSILSFVGLVKIDTPNGTSGEVVVAGPVENVNTTAALDRILYISKTGGLTDTQPELGIGGFISGDIIIKVGKVSKNTTNGALKDVVVQPQIIGQL